MRTPVTVLLTLALALPALPAWAQYYLQSKPGYTQTPVAAGNGQLAGADLLASACDCTGLQLDGLLRIDPGMSTYIEFDRGGTLRLREFRIASNKKTPTRKTDAVKYNIGGSPIYLGFGLTDKAGYEEYVLATMVLGGEVRELDRTTLGAPYIAAIYALDLNADGVVELAVPYSTGASGGGVDVRAVVPTGGLAWFGNDELDSTLFSQHGYLNVLDYDGDGDWELETTAPVLCSACGYMWNDLYTFDPEGWNWETAETQFAAYYAPQREFYKQLNAAVVRLASSPASLKYTGSAIEAQYATQIGGQWYTLDPFMAGTKVDRTWVSTLASFVSGW